MISSLLPSFSTKSGRPAFWYILFLLGGLLSTASWPALAQTIQGAGGSEALQPNSGVANHRLMVCTDGTVTGWGVNNFGELGSASSYPSYVPTPAPLNVGLPGSAV